MNRENDLGLGYVRTLSKPDHAQAAGCREGWLDKLAFRRERAKDQGARNRPDGCQRVSTDGQKIDMRTAQFAV
jgi:hypothetical protein